MNGNASQANSSRKSSLGSRLQPVCQSRYITVVGSMNMDQIWYVPWFPRNNSETISIGKHMAMPGGKGLTQAMACKRLSRTSPNSSHLDRPLIPSSRKDVDINVDLIGVLGNDRAGQDMVRILKRENFSLKNIYMLENASTGMANIIVDQNGDRSVILFNGANRGFHSGDIPFPSPAPHLLMLQLEHDPNMVFNLIREAKTRRVAVLLNAAPAEEIPDDVYKILDHLVLNKIEADTLLKLPKHELEANLADIPRLELVKKYRSHCQAFLDKGVKNVVITLGGHGGVAANKETTVDYEAERVERIQDRTGCGAVFIGAYAVEIMIQDANDGCVDIGRAVKWASKAAALSIGTQGSMDGIPYADHLDPA